MNTATRQERLVQTMRRRGHGSVSALAADLEVSRRTLLRDLDALRDRGFRIESSSGRGGGVSMDPGSVLVSPQLAVDEIVALMLAVASLRATPWIPMAGGAEAALSKIEKSLPEDRLRGLRRMLERVLVVTSSRGDERAARIDLTLLLAFEEAFRGHRMLAFGYVDRAGRRTRRIVEPQGMLVHAPVWYVIAWDPTRAAIRRFRMDRIRSPRVLDEVFSERPMESVLSACPDAKTAEPASRFRRV